MAASKSDGAGLTDWIGIALDLVSSNREREKCNRRRTAGSKLVPGWPAQLQHDRASTTFVDIQWQPAKFMHPLQKLLQGLTKPACSKVFLETQILETVRARCPRAVVLGSCGQDPATCFRTN